MHGKQGYFVFVLHVLVPEMGYSLLNGKLLLLSCQ